MKLLPPSGHPVIRLTLRCPRLGGCHEPRAPGEHVNMRPQLISKRSAVADVSETMTEQLLRQLGRGAFHGEH
eukprot:scaffold21627_cov71-Phaeocystis_antarctica.AAC.2